MLNSYDIEELIDTIKDELEKQILLANRTGELEQLLDRLGFSDLVKKESVYETQKNGKIVVIGASEVRLNVLQGIIKSLGLDKNRFEFCLDYEESKKYNYRKLRYAPNYRVVMFGPLPHSTSGKNDSNSVISEMMSKEGYPRVITLTGSNELKITKTGFRTTLEKLIAEKYI